MAWKRLLSSSILENHFPINIIGFNPLKTLVSAFPDRTSCKFQPSVLLAHPQIRPLSIVKANKVGVQIISQIKFPGMKLVVSKLACTYAICLPCFKGSPYWHSGDNAGVRLY